MRETDRQKMAAQAPAIVVDNYRVEHGGGFSLPVITLADRRAAGNRLVRFVFQRHLEAVLFGRTEGSSWPIWKLMNRAGIGSTTLPVSKPSIAAGVITEEEFNAIMRVFKDSLPSDIVDPCSLGRIRCCTLLPLAAAATVVRSFGRSGASMAWLRAVSQPIPQGWELREEQEQNDAEGEVDLVLNEQLDEQGFEAEEMSFAEELMTMPAFSADADDETRLKTYTLQRVPPLLKSQLEQYTLHRTATFAARRQGGAVQSISAETDCNALLRFYGWQAATHHADVGGDFSFMLRPDLGDIAQEYASWLQNTQQCKFSTIANYLNGLVSITTYCYANLEPNDALLALEPSPLTQLINLRGQAEKASKTQQMYEKRVGGWLEWPDVQKARVTAMSKLSELPPGESAAKRALLRDACALSLLSLIPPDSVGCIRKLRLNHTLKRKQGGGWMMDLSKQRDGHKTSRFYGPFAASLPSELNPILDKYVSALEFDGLDEAGPYLFHPPHGNSDRAMESSSWSQWVSRLFKRHADVAIAPKTLRSIFITWLRDNTDSPEVLKAAAHAMKHSEQLQASDDYDQQHGIRPSPAPQAHSRKVKRLTQTLRATDDRLVKAAYEFNLKFAAGFSASAAGSSSDAPPPAAVDAQPAAADGENAEAEDEEDVYEVEAILEEKVSAGKKQDGFRKGSKLFFVRWVGYSDPTWELASNVGKAAVDEYEERKRSGAPPPPPPPPQRNT